MSVKIFLTCSSASPRALRCCDDRRIVDTGTQKSAQRADVLHTRDDEDTVQVSQCKNEREIRKEEAVRERMGAKVCWTPEERVALQTRR